MSDTQSTGPSEPKPAPPKRGRLARVANIFFPVSEVAAAARSARSSGSSIGSAVGAVASRLRAVLRRQEEPQPTAIVDELLADDGARSRALRFARVRWSVGVILMVLGMYQLGSAMFTGGGVIAAVNFLLSALLLGIFGLWLAMVAARDAAALSEVDPESPPVTNLEVLKTPALWVPW